jgi:hypothetical protein
MSWEEAANLTIDQTLYILTGEGGLEEMEHADEIREFIEDVDAKVNKGDVQSHSV